MYFLKKETSKVICNCPLESGQANDPSILARRLALSLASTPASGQRIADISIRTRADSTVVDWFALSFNSASVLAGIFAFEVEACL